MVKDPREAVVSEFVNYYNADELPLILAGDVDAEAGASGGRLVHVLGARAREAVALLQRVVDDSEGALLEELDRRTMYAWRGTEEDWELFLRIVHGISVSVEHELSTRAAQAHGDDQG